VGKTRLAGTIFVELFFHGWNCCQKWDVCGEWAMSVTLVEISVTYMVGDI
jgi:hypothetical protein